MILSNLASLILLAGVLAFLTLWVWVVVKDHRPLIVLTAVFVVACGCLLAALAMLAALTAAVGIPD